MTVKHHPNNSSRASDEFQFPQSSIPDFQLHLPLTFNAGVYVFSYRHACRESCPGDTTIMHISWRILLCFKIPKFDSANYMFPRPLPAPFKGLTMIAHQLIARCHPLVRAYGLARGKHILNLDQSVGMFAICLLCHTNSDYIPTLVVEAPAEGTWEGRSFNTSSVRVENALGRPIANSLFYRDIVINRDNLAALPTSSDTTFDGVSLLAKIFTGSAVASYV